MSCWLISLNMLKQHPGLTKARDKHNSSPHSSHVWQECLSASSGTEKDLILLYLWPMLLLLFVFCLFVLFQWYLGHEEEKLVKFQGLSIFFSYSQILAHVAVRRRGKSRLQWQTNTCSMQKQRSHVKLLKYKVILGIKLWISTYSWMVQQQHVKTIFDLFLFYTNVLYSLDIYHRVDTRGIYGLCQFCPVALFILLHHNLVTPTIYIKAG